MTSECNTSSAPFKRSTLNHAYRYLLICPRPGSFETLLLLVKCHARKAVPLALLLFLCARTGQAATAPNDPTTEWTTLPYPVGYVSDYLSDQQTGSGSPEAD